MSLWSGFVPFARHPTTGFLAHRSEECHAHVLLLPYRQLKHPIRSTRRTWLSEVSCKHSLVQALFRALPNGRCLARFDACRSPSLRAGFPKERRERAENARRMRGRPALAFFQRSSPPLSSVCRGSSASTCPPVCMEANPTHSAALPAYPTPLVLPIETVLAALKDFFELRLEAVQNRRQYAAPGQIEPSTRMED